MPANEPSVNLLGHDAIQESPIGRIVTWATTYGRYIMIATEIVVLLAFVSRFSLDRRLTDLNEAISQKSAIIEANIPFEQEILDLQNLLAQAKSIIQDQQKPLEVLNQLKSFLPADVYLSKFSIQGGTVKLKAVAQSTGGFTVFLRNLQSTKLFSRVDMSDVKKIPSEGIVFEITAQMASEKKPEAPAAAPTNNVNTPDTKL